jgi:hypothetical protein
LVRRLLRLGLRRHDKVLHHLVDRVQNAVRLEEMLVRL